MGCRRYVVIYIIFVIPFGSSAQHTAQVCRWISASGEAVILDSLSIDPSSIRISTMLDYQADVDYDLTTGKVRVNTRGGLDTVEVCYSQLPFALHRTWQNRSLAQYDSNALFKAPAPVVAGFGLPKEELFPSSGLTKTGSITRSISFGNTQNVFVNGQLNLQLQGKITDDLNIRAVITDQNIPFQPEGNTLQLQEFDKVFMQIFNDNFSITAGDVLFEDPVSNNQPASHFLRYNKNVQGVQLKTKYELVSCQL